MKISFEELKRMKETLEAKPAPEPKYLFAPTEEFAKDMMKVLLAPLTDEEADKLFEERWTYKDGVWMWEVK